MGNNEKRDIRKGQETPWWVGSWVEEVKDCLRQAIIRTC